MFELSILASAASEDASSITITDESVWASAPLADRAKYGVFLVANFQVSETITPAIITAYDPLIATSWVISTPESGRYTFNAYAFVLRGEEAPSEGVVHIHTDGNLYKYVSAAWVSITLEEAIAETAEAYASSVLDVPYLAFAYIYRNKLNLEYIKEVKKDMQNGATQNKLYYKRTDLDYFTSLITGAEYNWSLGFFSNYYEIVNNLNTIIAGNKTY